MLSNISTMSVTNFASMIAVAAIVVGPLTTTSSAQVAGSTVLGVSAAETDHLIMGWSAEIKLLGCAVYNDANDKVGTLEDNIVTPEDAVSYAIIGVGGFLGIDKRDVAVPMNQLLWVNDKLVLGNATKDSLEALPPFQYSGT